MRVILWPAGAAALLSVGMSAGAALAAAPATAVPLRSPVVGSSTDTGGFPAGQFWIRSAYKEGKAGEACMVRHAAHGRKIGYLSRFLCDNSAQAIWTYDPATRQIRLAANPKICAWGISLLGATTAPCDPKQIPPNENKPALKTLMASPHARAWYRDAQQRLFIRRGGNANKPAYLATSAGTAEEHHAEGVMTPPEDINQFEPKTLVWHLVPPTAGNG